MIKLNTIYSTLIKKINAYHIIKGQVKPDTFKKLIDDSIENYRKYPLKGGIDYRHVLGRMISLKNMNQSLKNLMGRIPLKMQSLNWNDDNQLDLLAIIEILLSDFSKAKENYSRSNGFYTDFVAPFELTYEKTKELYKYNVIRLLSDTLEVVKKLMKTPLQNKELIEDKLDIAYAYFDKFEYNNEFMPDLMKFYAQLREQDKFLTKKTKKH